MKNLSLILLFSVLFSSCYNHYSSTYRNHKDGVQQPHFTSIPIKPSVEKVKIIFPGEKFPEEPYIKVAVIDVFGNVNMSTQDMIAKLQQQAKIKGMDAIIIISQDNISELFQDDLYEGYIVTTQKHSALGIKFIKNITYLDKCIKGGSILKWDETKNEYINEAKFKSDWKGNLIKLESGGNYFYNFLYNFSLQHLAYERNRDWLFKTIKSSPIEQRIKRVKRNYSGDGTYSKEVKVKTVNGEVIFVQVQSHLNHIYSGRINVQYDKNNQIIKKSIQSEILGEFQQKFNYDEKGTLSEIEVFQIKNENSTPYFKVVFENYQQSDLADLLEKNEND